jgi:hypothetical protein
LILDSIILALILFLHYPGHTANLSVVQLHFDTAGMISGAGKQSFYKTTSKVTCTLIFLQDNINLQARVYIASVLSVHFFSDYTDYFMVSPIYINRVIARYEARASPHPSPKERVLNSFFEVSPLGGDLEGLLLRASQ